MLSTLGELRAGARLGTRSAAEYFADAPPVDAARRAGRRVLASGRRGDIGCPGACAACPSCARASLLLAVPRRRRDDHEHRRAAALRRRSSRGARRRPTCRCCCRRRCATRLRPAVRDGLGATARAGASTSPRRRDCDEAHRLLRRRVQGAARRQAERARARSACAAGGRATSSRSPAARRARRRSHRVAPARRGLLDPGAGRRAQPRSASWCGWPTRRSATGPADARPSRSSSTATPATTTRWRCCSRSRARRSSCSA